MPSFEYVLKVQVFKKKSSGDTKSKIFLLFFFPSNFLFSLLKDLCCNGKFELIIH